MKIRTILVLAVLALAIFAYRASAADQKNFLESVSVQTSAAYKTPNFDNGVWGAAVDVNLKLNKHISLTLESVAYEDFGASAIDESSLLVRANLLTSANKKLTLYGICGGVRDWENDDWGFGVGLGLAYDITKRVYIGASTQVRAYIHQEKDLLTTTGIGFRF